MNLPAIFFQLPVAIAALPITLFLESWFRYDTRLRISRRQRFTTALLMNLCALFLGMPTIFVAGFAILLSISADRSIPDWISGLYVISPEPVSGFSTAVLWLIPTFLTSVLIESLIAQRHLSHIAEADAVRRWVVKANVVSHSGLAIAMVIYWAVTFRTVAPLPPA